jgi:hypothetical protein
MQYKELFLQAHELGYPFSEVFVSYLEHPTEMSYRMELTELGHWLSETHGIFVWWRPSGKTRFFYGVTDYAHHRHLSSSAIYSSPQAALYAATVEALKFIQDAKSTDRHRDTGGGHDQPSPARTY